ncbi:MAG: hypothetical protein PHY74_01980 [Candidatus Bathyarchaeota archaeon]|nr:hypothetical protein [Candidatus Bathyarchaeota archaeon]
MPVRAVRTEGEVVTECVVFLDLEKGECRVSRVVVLFCTHFPRLVKSLISSLKWIRRTQKV